MTLTVVARQALREGFKTKEQIEAFVTRLRSGEAAFPDEAGEGRSRSLGASLAYGFEQAFREEELKRLALLHLFQGSVNVNVLRIMGGLEFSWCLPEVRGLTREEGIALLDRAAEVGLLAANGDGIYSIHPALPWFFKGLFEQYHPADDLAAVRAFVEAMGVLGNYYHDQYEDGTREVLQTLRTEEANLLHARLLARAHGWWHRIISNMQGLRHLYDHTGRRAEWKRLVEETMPDFLDLDNGGPLPEREEDWSLVTEYKVRLAAEERHWVEAERIQRIRVAQNRRRAAPGLARSMEELASGTRGMIRALAVSLEQLGHIRRELGHVECVQDFEEALGLSDRIGDQAEAAICAFNLGQAFLALPSLRDLDQAEHWYRKSLERYSSNPLRRSRCLDELGTVALQRFLESQAAARSENELLPNLNEAVRLYQEALKLTPPDAVDPLAVTHYHLGVTYLRAGDLDRAVQHYREAIQYDELQGDTYGAALARFEVALAFSIAGRSMDALEYAEAALRGFDRYGERATQDIEDTRRLIAEIRGRRAEPGQPVI